FERQLTASQTRTQSIDWNEYERTNQLQSANVGNRAPERTDSTAYRPVSRKYREEQRELEQANESRREHEQSKQPEIKRQSRTITRDQPGLER
ncbi:hypothetical protein, partial [Priestia filamentosa]|uniref:hypothetical protein n=1 Tax=Priestia filamentosa TaxID=1402861 RepID=UPI00397E12F7